MLVLKQDDASRVSTIILKRQPANAMDDLERAMDDGVNAYKALTRDSRAVPAGGATEIALAKRLGDYAKTQTGLDQYAIQKFAQPELVPRTLEAAGGTSVIASLYAAHSSSNENNSINNRMGVDVSGDQETIDLLKLPVSSICLEVKHWALKLAVDAARTVFTSGPNHHEQISGRRPERPQSWLMVRSREPSRRKRKRKRAKEKRKERSRRVFM